MKTINMYGKEYKVIEGVGYPADCELCDIDCQRFPREAGCDELERDDGVNVYFVEVKMPLKITGSSRKSNVMRASSVMQFAEAIKGAYESGFIDNSPTIYDIYRMAQNHVKDNYGIDTENWNNKRAALGPFAFIHNGKRQLGKWNPSHRKHFY